MYVSSEIISKGKVEKVPLKFCMLSTEPVEGDAEGFECDSTSWAWLAILLWELATPGETLMALTLFVMLKKEAVVLICAASSLLSWSTTRVLKRASCSESLSFSLSLGCWPILR